MARSRTNEVSGNSASKKSCLSALVLLLALVVFMAPSVSAEMQSVGISSPVDGAQISDPTPAFTFIGDSNTSLTLNCTLYVDDVSVANNPSGPNGSTFSLAPGSSILLGDHNGTVECSDDVDIMNSSTVLFRVTGCEGATTNFTCVDGTSAINQNCTFNGNVSESTCAFTITTSDIVVDGAGYSLMGGGTDAISAQDVDNITIQNLNIYGHSLGIRFTSVSNSRIYNNTFTSVGVDAIAFDSGGSSSNANNTVEFNNGTSNDVGIYLAYGTNATVINNTFASSTQDGLYIGISNSYVADNNFSGNYDGIRAIGGSNTFTNNTMNGNTNTGITSYVGSNNAIDSNTVNSNGAYGIYAVQSNGNNITNNILAGNGEAGIVLNNSNGSSLGNNNASSSPYGAYLSSSNLNTVSNFIGNATTYYGIFLEQSSNNTISDSTGISDANIGIFINWNSNYNTAFNSTGTSNTSQGIQLEGGSNYNTIANCTGASTSSHAFAVYSSSEYNTIANCTAANSVTGFLVYSSSNNNLSDNAATSNTNGLWVEGSNNTLVTNDYYADNTVDLRFVVSEADTVLNLSNVIFDNPAANFTNYTNLSISNSVEMSPGGYNITWAAEPAALPAGMRAFAGKYIDISADNAMIDTTLWSWDAAELDPAGANYSENQFAVLKYSGGNWVGAGSVLDNVSHTLTVLDIMPGTVYGILEVNDSVAPTVDLNSPNGTWTNSDNVTINFTATDDVATTLICDVIDNGVPQNWSISAANGTPTEVNFIFSEGFHAWDVNCTDYASNWAINGTPLNFTVDLTPPSIALLFPIDGYLTNDSAVNLGFNATDNLDPILSCNITVYPGPLSIAVLAANGTQANDTQSYADGVFFWNVTCADEAGNWNDSTETRNFTVDTTWPLIDYGTNNEADAALLNRSWAYFEAAFTEANPDACTLALDNGTSFNMPNINATHCWMNQTMADGDYSYNIALNDTVGHVNITVNRTLTIDTSIPSVTNVTIATPLNTSTVLNFSANVTDVGTIDAVLGEVNCSGENMVNLTMSVLSGNTYYNDSFQLFYEGECTVRIFANDSFGAMNGSETATETVDSTPRTIVSGETINLTQDINCTGATDPACFVLNQTENVTFDCNGNTIYSDGTGPAFAVLNGTNITFMNCVIENFGMGFMFGNSTGVLFENMTVDTSNYGVDGQCVGGSSFANSIFNGQAQSGMGIIATAGCPYSNNIIENNSYTNSTGTCLDVADDSNTIRNNTFDDCSIAIHLNTTAAYNNTVYNNSITNSGDGILVDGENNTLYDLYVYNTTGSGVNVSSTGLNTSISSSTFDLIGSDGIMLDGAAGAAILNCSMANGTGYGVENDGGVNAVLADCTIEGFDHAAYFHGAADDALLANNTFRYNTNSGLQIAASVRASLSNNSMENNTNYGVYLNAADNASLVDTIVSYNGLYGMYALNTPGLAVSGGEFSNTTTNSGIYLSGSNGGVISGVNASNNGGAGIYLSNSDGNVISNSTGSSGSSYGIAVDGSTNNAVSGSNGTSTSSYGIYLVLSNFNNITDSAGTSTSGAGLHLINSPNNTISNSTGSSGSSYGIYLVLSGDNSIIGSNATSGTNNGIRLDTSPGNLFINNTNALAYSGTSAKLYSNSGQDTASLGNTGWWPLLASDGTTATLQASTAWYNGTEGGMNADLSPNTTLMFWYDNQPAPKMASVRIAPTAPVYANATLMGYCNATDIDSANLVYHYTWYVDGVANETGVSASFPAGVESNVANITSGNLTAWQNWTLECFANDSVYDSRPWMNSSVTEILPSCVGAVNAFVCGDTVTESCTMDSNLTSAGTCFSTGANDIAIDCSGYSLTGDTTGYGVENNGNTNVTLANCVITNYSTGAYWYGGAADGTIIDNNITGNGANIYIEDSDNCLAARNNASANNNGDAITVDNSDNVNITDSNVDNADEYGIAVEYSDYVLISGNNATNAQNYDGVRLMYSDYSTVSGNNLSGAASSGVNVFVSEFATVDSNYIEGSGSSGILFQGTSPNGFVNNNIVTGGSSGGISIYDSENTSAANNSVTGNGNDGVYLSNSGSSNVTGTNSTSNPRGIVLYLSPNCVLGSNNASDSTSTHGIAIYSSDNVTVSNSFADSNADAGIYIDTSSNAIVTGNNVSNGNNGMIIYYSPNASISGGVLDSNLNDGVHMEYSGDANISNVVSSNNYNGFDLSYCNNTNLTGNNATGNDYGLIAYESSGLMLFNNNVSLSDDIGIYVDSGCDSATLTENVADSNGGYGIYVWNSASPVLTGNNATNSGDNGIYLSSCDSPELYTNFADSGSNSGMYLASCDNALLDGNNASNNGYDGIHIEDSDNATVMDSLSIYNTNNGITVDPSDNAWLINNDVEYNYDGIYVDSSQFSQLHNNTARYNNMRGIYLYYSGNATLLNNTASNNNVALADMAGIEIYQSGQSSVTAGTTNTNGHGLYISYSPDCNLTENTALSNTLNGIEVSYSDNALLYNNTAGLNTLAGFNVTQSDNAQLFENTAGGVAAGNNDGFYLEYSDDPVLENNTVDWNNNYGIYATYCAAPVLTTNTLDSNSGGVNMDYSANAVLTDNVVSNSIGSGIYAYASGSASLAGNNVSDAGAGGIELWDSGSSNLTGNNITNAGSSFAWFGIYLSGSTACNLVANYVDGTTGQGVHLDGCDNSVLDSNTVSTSTSYGIMSEYSDSVAFTNNLVDSNADSGLLVSVSQLCSLTNNTALSNTYGFDIEDSNLTTLTGNNASGNTNSGIYLFQSDDATLTNNYADSNSEGIYFDTSSYGTVTGGVLDLNGYGLEIDNGGYNTFTGIDILNTDDDSINAGDTYYNTFTGIYISTPTDTANDGTIYLWNDFTNNTFDTIMINGTEYSGVYFTGSSTGTGNTFLDCTILDATNGAAFYFDGAAADNTILGCTIGGTGAEAFYFTGTSMDNVAYNTTATGFTPTDVVVYADTDSSNRFVNTTFDRTSATVADNANFSVYWYARALAQSTTAIPVSGVNADFREFAAGSVFMETTDASGLTSYFEAREYRHEAGDTYPASVTFFTPHSVKGTKSGYNTASLMSRINESKTVILIMVPTGGGGGGGSGVPPSGTTQASGFSLDICGGVVLGTYEYTSWSEESTFGKMTKMVITLKNSGSQMSKAFVFKQAVPAGTVNVQGVSPAASEQGVDYLAWNIPALMPGESTEISFQINGLYAFGTDDLEGYTPSAIIVCGPEQPLQNVTTQVNIDVPGTVNVNDTVTIIVTDQNGNPMPNVTVVITTPLGKVLRLVTDAEGKVTFIADAEGTYTYAVEGYIVGMAKATTATPKEAPIVPPKPQCTKDSDCGTGKVCTNSKCVAAPAPPAEPDKGIDWLLIGGLILVAAIIVGGGLLLLGGIGGAAAWLGMNKKGQ